MNTLTSRKESLDGSRGARLGRLLAAFAALIALTVWSGSALALARFQAAGVAVASLDWPTHAINDVALLFVETAGGQVPTLSVPAGFVEVTGSPQATGAGAAGTRITVFWARATSTIMASPTIVGPADHMYARIITYRGVVTAGNPWDITGGGVKAAASTSVTVTGVTTTVANARIVQAVARDNDSAGTAFSAETNANLTGIAERNDAGTTIGGGGGFGVWDGLKATAGATGNTTATVASSINAFFTIALRPQGAAAPTYQSAGTQYMGSGSNGLSPNWPAHSTNDVALLFVESAGDQPVTLSVAAGFVAVTNSPQATGTTAAGTRLTVFWARATSSAMTAPTIADPGDHVYARIITYRGVAHTGDPWDVTGGGVKAAASASVSVTGVTTTVANTLVVQAVTRHNDSAAVAFSAETNANLTGIAERSDAGTTSNNGGGIGIWDGLKATAGATGNTTANVTSSINAFLTIALKSQPGPIFSNAGTAVGGAGNVSLTWPAHAIDDVALLFVESAGGEPATLSVPAGFVQVTNSPQITGAGVSGTRITVFWARATSAAMTAPTVLDPGNHVYAQIITYRGVVNTGDPWDITGGGIKTPPASTTVTVTGVTTSVTDTLIVQAVARDNDSAAAAFSNQVNANLSGIGERNDAGTTSGNGGGFVIWDGYKATAGATGNTTATVTSSTNAFITIALKQQVLVTPPDHYELSLPASSVTCAAGTVTVTACANNTNPCALAMTTLAGQTATLAVSTSPAAPTCVLGATSVSFNAAGVATTTLDCSLVGDGATVTVTLSAEQTPATNLRKCCQGASCATANSCSATNKTAGFIFAAATDDVEADIAAQRAGVASPTYYLRAIRTNTSTLACEAALSGNNTVDLGYECINPAACTTSNLMNITAGTPSATTAIARNDSGSSASKTTVSMSFDANGNAPFTLTFNDVGKAKLHAYKAAGGALLTPLAGNTPNDFITAPYDFLVALTGPYVAGISFGANVTARTSGAATTPNFGRESPAESAALQAPTVAAASATNSELLGPLAPLGGQLGALTAGSFTRAKCSPVSNGSVCDPALAWNEVGRLVLSAATANGSGYLGSGLVSWGSAAAGPFKPAFLTTELDTAQPCTTFTYSGQPFRIKVSAMSAANAVLATAAAITQNYVSTGGYAKAVTLGSDDAGLCNPPTTTGFANNTLAATDFDATPGSASTPLVAPITYTQSLGAPSALTVCAKEDADTVNSHGQTQAVLAIRNGRLRLLGAYGSELLPLLVPIRVEYYNGTTWALGTDDTCTNPLASAFALSNGIAANTSISSVTLSGGSGTLKLAVPSPVATGLVDVAANLGTTGTATDTSCNPSSPAGTTAANLPWLQFAWCAGKLDPNARIKFGSPKAPYIYLRENY